MAKRDDESLAEQNAEIWRWAEANGLRVGAIFGEQRDAVELAAPRGHGAHRRGRVRGGDAASNIRRYDSASEVVEEALREWGRGY